MGAAMFITIETGPNAKAAFDAAREEAAYEHGHGGYTGTIAEKDDFVTFDIPVPAGATEEAARAYLDNEDAWPVAVKNKCGPAGHVDLGGDRHLFFGWASE